MLDRRQFLSTSAALGAGVLSSCSAAGSRNHRPADPSSSADTNDCPSLRVEGFDPWIEVNEAALMHNARQVRALAGGRPVMAVVKNDAYGLGLRATTPVLNRSDAIGSFGVVKAEEALVLRRAGVTKPILLMGLCSVEEARALVEHQVELSVYTDDALERVRALRVEHPVDVQLYLDTGLGRLGMPTHRALDWALELAQSGKVRIRGSFMTFTEESDFDPEQLRRFREFANALRDRGVEHGPLHAATSNALFHLAESHLDQVRPGLALYGAYPARVEEARKKAELRCALRLCAPVLRMERLRPGDSAGYGRRFVATEPTWVATLPVGHADGYARESVEGARVWIGGQVRPVVGAVSASHCLVDCGPEPIANLGDVAVLLGPDDEAVTPNAVSSASGVSVYDVTMHLSSRLPRVVV